MPAVSQAQRGFLANKFGVAWMKRHHFTNPGKLPEHVKPNKAQPKKSK
jgi:hypothetical protein